MKNISKITIVFLFLLVGNQAQAQFFKKLQKKIENKIEQRIEQKADQKADQAMDSVFSDRPFKKEKKSSQEKEQGDFDLGGMMEAVMNRKPAEFESSYSFDFTMVMEIISEKSKPMKMKTSYGDTAYFVQMERGTSVITDFKNEAMITINEDKKTAQAVSLGFIKSFDINEMSEDFDMNDVTVERTGKVKTIRGYRCEQYIISDQDFTTDGWFTKEVNFDFASYAKSMSEVFKTNASQAFVEGNMGFPIEMISTTKEGDEITMKILEITEGQKGIDLTNYKVSQL